MDVQRAGRVIRQDFDQRAGAQFLIDDEGGLQDDALMLQGHRLARIAIIGMHARVQFDGHRAAWPLESPFVAR